MHASGGEPGRVDRVKSMLPMQRGGQPEEVAQAIVWLLSEKASYVTGVLSSWRAGSKRLAPEAQEKYRFSPLLAITSLYQSKLFLRERDMSPVPSSCLFT
jgi:hypothetical protein